MSTKQIEETVERIVRNALAHARLGVKFERSVEDERKAAIEPLEPHTLAVLAQLKECLGMASLQGSNSVHQALHAQPGVDPFMLDEAVEYAPNYVPKDDPENG